MRYFFILSPIFCLLSCFLGCGLFPKGDSNTTRPPQNDRLPATNLSGGNPRTTQNGILAGQVIDNTNQRRGGVTINVQALEGSDSKQAITNDQGYFTIQGLQPGKKYKLVASSKSGNAYVSGTTEAMTPNVVVLIKLSESRQESDGKPTAFSGSVGGMHSSIADPSGATRDWPATNPGTSNPAATGRGDRLGPANDLNQPPNNTPPPGNARLGRPTTADTTEPNPGVPTRPEYMTQTTPLPKSEPTLLTVPGPGPNSTEPTPRRTNTLSDGRYFNHPLLDLDQRPTTLAAYRGRLTLVDVWGTWCAPCIRSMPELNALRKNYSEKGLVVVGITVRSPEEKGNIQSQIQSIQLITSRVIVNYPILIEQETQPIRDAFQIKLIPTLILLDENGNEVWRATGLSDETRRQLDQELQHRLK